MRNKNLKKAFTLAEMLIVLVIIGVLSTLCIRSINDERDKQEAAVRLQKSYEEISKALANGILENGSVDYWDFSLTPDEFIATYLKTIKFGNGIQRISDNTIKDDRVDIFVDTNGSKFPDKVGMDRFVISISTDGTVLLPTWKDGDSLDKTVKTRTELIEGCKSDGYSCGALIQHDGWKIKKDYPWKERKES